VATIWWAAIGDGRTDAEMRRREQGAGTDPQLGRREEEADGRRSFAPGR
jgi:hypothetical protein